MKNILVVHQSAELYGSDKVLLTLMSELNRDKYHPIVLLPFDGPLVSELKFAGIECHVLPIVRLSRSTLSLMGLLRLPQQLLISIRSVKKILNNRHIDLVHSNTLAVLSGAIWARWNNIPHIWHVHEIIVKPIIVRKVYAQLLNWLSDYIICISNATKNNLLQDKPSLANKIQVVWNGLNRNEEIDKYQVQNYRKQLLLSDEDILIVLMGRVNRWKGHGLLVEAASLLWSQNIRNIKFLIVGSAPDGQLHFLSDLQKAINLSPAKQLFILQEFIPNPWKVWDACDIAIIPSIEPEPFGMVALEAMASSKPVIAADHGGLKEIVLDGETGLRVQPGDATGYANAIKRLTMDKYLRRQMGKAGELRYRTVFKLDYHVSNITAIYDHAMANS